MQTASDAAQLLTRELRAFQREILLFPDDTTVWATLPGITNSAGNLALHVAGNLRHFVGAVLGGIPYARNREDELGRRTGTKAEIVALLDAAISAVETALTARVVDGEFPERPAGHRLDARLFVTHLCVHTSYHLGQAGYLRRALTGDPRTGAALSLQEIALPSQAT